MARQTPRIRIVNSPICNVRRQRIFRSSSQDLHDEQGFWNAEPAVGSANLSSALRLDLPVGSPSRYADPMYSDEAVCKYVAKTRISGGFSGLTVPEVCSAKLPVWWLLSGSISSSSGLGHKFRLGKQAKPWRTPFVVVQGSGASRQNTQSPAA